MSKYQRDKGANFERTVANLFKESGISAKRGLLQTQDKTGAPDVVVDELPGLWVECKKGKKTYPIAALKQAREACQGHGIPLAVCADDYDKVTVTMEWEFFILLLTAFLETKDLPNDNPQKSKNPSALDMDSGGGSMGLPIQTDWIADSTKYPTGK